MNRLPPCRRRLFPGRWLPAALVLGLILPIIGCGAAAPAEPPEVRALDAPLVQEELDLLLRVLARLPDGKLTDLPPLFPPPPAWSPHRIVAVRDLCDDEQAAVAKHWKPETLAAKIAENRLLVWSIENESLTTEQFAALLQSVGLAMARLQWKPPADLPLFKDEAKTRLEKLNQDGRHFSNLPPARQFEVLRDAVWLARDDRMTRCESVPEESLELVAPLLAELREKLPADYGLDPLGVLADPFEEQGIPFDESSPTLRDSTLSYERP